MPGLGMIQVYTGNGKGKTTASLGLALRACGHNMKVCMIQFMKDDKEYGEFIASKFLPNFRIIQVGRNDFVNLSDPEQIDVELAKKGWTLAQDIINSGEYDIVILDEINVAMACGLIDTSEVVNFIKKLSQQGNNLPELILTGRYAPQAIMDIAHLVTEMREVAHPYNSGVSSREGIEH